MRHPQRLLFGVLVIVLLGITFSVYLLHNFLVVDNPQPSDVILVPAGDFMLRSTEAVKLARQGFAGLVLVDEGTDTRTFGRTLAEHRENQTGDFPIDVRICAIKGETTFEESLDAQRCLDPYHPRRVLIVTSDFHTRRSLAIFRKQMPAVSFSVFAVATEYSTQSWWRPESLATTLEESAALIWWRLKS